MVTAAVAEVTATRITVYNMDRRVAAYRARGDELEWQKGDDPAGRKGGVNLDEADYQLEKLGWITTGHWRWIENGGFYKSVVLPVDHPRLKVTPWVNTSKTPEQLREQNMRVWGTPDGRRLTEREYAARTLQYGRTGKADGWQKVYQEQWGTAPPSSS